MNLSITVRFMLSFWRICILVLTLLSLFLGVLTILVFLTLNSNFYFGCAHYGDRLYSISFLICASYSSFSKIDFASYSSSMLKQSILSKNSCFLGRSILVSFYFVNFIFECLDKPEGDMHDGLPTFISRLCVGKFLLLYLTIYFRGFCLTFNLDSYLGLVLLKSWLLLY